MIIELVGPPGVGKSTLGPQLVDQLRRKGVEAALVDLRWVAAPRGKWRVLNATIGMLLIRPGPSWMLALWALRVRSRRDLRRSVSVLRRDAVARWIDDRHRVVVLDEGPVHSLLWVASFYERSWGRGLARALGKVTRPAALVLVDAPTEEAAARLLRRGRFYASLGITETTQVVTRYRRHAKEATRILNVPVIHATHNLADDLVSFLSEGTGSGGLES